MRLPLMSALAGDVTQYVMKPFRASRLKSSFTPSFKRSRARLKNSLH
jgi:hypothetical protein